MAQEQRHDQEAMRALKSFRQIISAVKRHVQSVRAQCDLTGAQLSALWQIAMEPGVNAGQLARMLALHPSTLSNLLEQLQSKGLIRRERMGRDQRVVRLFPTYAGEAVLKRAPGAARGVLADAIHQLPDAELQRLNESLDLLMRSIDVKDEHGEAAQQPLSDFIS